MLALAVAPTPATTAALRLAALLTAGAAPLDGGVLDEDAAAGAVLAGLREHLHEPGAHALARHLDQAERGHLGDLVLRAVPAQALHETAQHEVAVGPEHHVDEVDDDDAADVPQAQLPDDLLGGLEVVLGDGLLEVAAGARELAGVHVHHGHGLGAVDHERAAGGQVHLALERLVELLVHAVGGVQVLAVVVLRHPVVQPVQQVRGHVGHVGLDVVPRGLALHEHGGEVLVEDVADRLDGQVRLGVEQLGGEHLGAGRLLLDALPLGAQTVDVVLQLLLGGALGRGAHDHAGVLRQVVLEDLLQTRALHVRQLAGDAGHRASGHVHEVAAGQGDLAGQAGALVAHRVLGDLDEHGVAGLERVLDLPGLAVQLGGVPVDLARVEHGVASAADVHERGLHGRQHVLDLAQVHVADHRVLRGVRDEVLGQHAVLEHGDLDALVALAHQHLAVHGLAAGQELGLGDHGAATPARAGVAAALALRLEPGGALDALDGVRGGADGLARCAHAGDGVLGIAGLAAVELHVHLAAAAPATPTGDHGALGPVLGLSGVLPVLGVRRRVCGALLRVAALARGATTARTPGGLRVVLSLGALPRRGLGAQDLDQVRRHGERVGRVDLQRRRARLLGRVRGVVGRGGPLRLNRPGGGVRRGLRHGLLGRLLHAFVCAGRVLVVGRHGSTSRRPTTPHSPPPGVSASAAGRVAPGAVRHGCAGRRTPRSHRVDRVDRQGPARNRCALEIGAWASRAVRRPAHGRTRAGPGVHLPHDARRGGASAAARRRARSGLPRGVATGRPGPILSHPPRARA